MSPVSNNFSEKTQENKKSDDFKRSIDKIREEVERKRILEDTFNIIHLERSITSDLSALKEILDKEERDVRTDTTLQGELRGFYNAQIDPGSIISKEMIKIQEKKKSYPSKFKEILHESQEDVILVDCNRCGKCCCNVNISPVVTMYDLCVYLNLFRNESIDILKNLTIFHYRDTKIKGEESEGFLPTIRKINDHCVYYNDEEGCLIYKNRPIDCRIYPGLPTLPEIELQECPCDSSTYLYLNDSNLNSLPSDEVRLTLDENIASRMKNSGIWTLFMKLNKEIIKERPAYFWQFLMTLALDLQIPELSQHLEDIISR